MLINEETGKLRCDQCGEDLDDEVLVVEGSDTLRCAGCVARLAGYREGQQQSARELLEFAVLWAVRDLGADGLRAEVERLLETGRPMYVQVP